MYGKKFSVIRNVPRSSSLADKVPAGRIILYQGDLNEGRGLEQMIAAMQQVDAVFWIAGDGLLMESLKRSVQELGVQERVKFLGYLRPDALKEVTQQAMIGLNILENRGLSYYYSLANKFFDYVQAGIPQVCAPFPEYERINAQYPVALLCDCDTPALVNTLNSLLHDSALYEKLRSATLDARNVLNWEAEEQQLLNIYACL
jgi:glycosyltransferase involved in cell wall biosynthesis